MTWIPAGVGLTRLRQGLYRFFAGAMLPPDRDRIDALLAAGDLLSRSGVDAFAFAPAWWPVRAELERLPGHQELAATHVRLFAAGTDGALCPPSESFYLSEPRQGGPALVLADLECDFARNGVAVATGAGMTADQVSPQLELMAVLCERQAEGTEAGDPDAVADAIARQQQFLDNHLGRWIPRFAARTRRLAGGGLYGAVVAAIAAFVDHDRELVHALACPAEAR